MNGALPPSKPYFVKSSRASSSTRSMISGSSTRSHLFTKTTSSGMPTCRASKICSLVCGIGPAAAESSKYCTIHLRRPGNHVLDVIRMAGTVDVGVVPFFCLVLDVAGNDGDGLILVTNRATPGNGLVALE